MNEGMYIGAMYAAGKIRDDMAYNQIVAAFIAQGMSSEQAVIAANNHWNAQQAARGPSLIDVVGTISLWCFGLFAVWMVFFLLFLDSDDREDDFEQSEDAQSAPQAYVPPAEVSTSDLLAAALQTQYPTDVYFLGDTHVDARNGIAPIDSATLHGVDDDAIAILHFTSGAEADQYVDGLASDGVLLCQGQSSVFLFYGRAFINDEDYFLSEHCR